MPPESVSPVAGALPSASSRSPTQGSSSVPSRRKELICRLEHSQRYQLTPLGRKVAVLFLKAHGRVLGPGFALLDTALPPDIAVRSPLALAWRRLDQIMDRQFLAA
jgi:hypothetical protein